MQPAAGVFHGGFRATDAGHLPGVFLPEVRIFPG